MAALALVRLCRGGGMAATAELQGKYQKLAQEYSKVSRARPRAAAAAPLQPLPAPPLLAVA